MNTFANSLTMGGTLPSYNVRKKLYETKARTITNCVRKHWFGKQEQGVHLDHKFSIQAGFINQIPLSIICNRANLELIPAKTNLAKGCGCSITRDHLLATYEPDPKLDHWVTYFHGRQLGQLKRWQQLSWEWSKKISNAEAEVIRLRIQTRLMSQRTPISCVA